MVTEINKGERDTPYRDGKTIRQSKIAKMNWSNTWFLKGNSTGTISCPTTPGGILKKSLSKKINANRSTYKQLFVIEDGGQPIHCGLRVADPMRPNGCIYGKSDCTVSKGNCNKIGVIYRITCLTCQDEITDNTDSHNSVGLTRTTLHNRME